MAKTETVTLAIPAASVAWRAVLDRLQGLAGDDGFRDACY